MSRKPRAPLTDEEGEVRELLDEDFAAMRPAKEVLPPDLYENLIKRKPGQRGLGKKPAKMLVTLRVDPEVVDAYRATGRGWQTRMTTAIKQGLGPTSTRRSRKTG